VCCQSSNEETFTEFRHFLTEQYRENEFPGIWTYLHRDVDIFIIGLSYDRSNNEFCAEEGSVSDFSW